jgi:hypothetical protein
MHRVMHYCPAGCPASIPVVVEPVTTGWRIVSCRSYSSLAGVVARDDELYDRPVVHPRPMAARPGPAPRPARWAEALLAALREGHNLRRACQRAGVSYWTVRDRRQVDQVFSEAVAEARREGRRCASR